MTRKERLILALLAIGAALLGFGVWLGMRTHYQTVAPGMTRREVEQRIGEPKWTFVEKDHIYCEWRNIDVYVTFENPDEGERAVHVQQPSVVIRVINALRF